MSRWSDVIYFETKEIIKDELFQEIEVPGQPREVFANKKSITQSEFFKAGSSGLKPSKLFEVRSVEYNDEKFLTFQEKSYSIYRTYEKGENIELYCEVRTGAN